MRCPDCGEPFSEAGYRVHRGMRHTVRRCRWRGDNRSWCVTHDASWRIDRRKCEASWDAIDQHFYDADAAEPKP